MADLKSLKLSSLTATVPKIAPYFDSGTAYSKGDIVSYNGQTYMFTSAHAAGAWNANHVTAIDLGTAVSVMQSVLGDDVISNVGDSVTEAIGNTALGTTATTLSGAIAEHESELGNTDISGIGGGTVTGAISTLNSKTNFTRKSTHSAETTTAALTTEWVNVPYPSSGTAIAITGYYINGNSTASIYNIRFATNYVQVALRNNANVSTTYTITVDFLCID